MKVTEDHISSLQMQTSKTDVYIKIQVLDNEQEVACAMGKGHVVLPAFIFLKDVNPDDSTTETRRPSSRSCK